MGKKTPAKKQKPKKPKKTLKKKTKTKSSKKKSATQISSTAGRGRPKFHLAYPKAFERAQELYKMGNPGERIVEILHKELDISVTNLTLMKALRTYGGITPRKRGRPSGHKNVYPELPIGVHELVHEDFPKGRVWVVRTQKGYEEAFSEKEARKIFNKSQGKAG